MIKKILLGLLFLLIIGAILIFFRTRDLPFPDYEAIAYPNAKNLSVQSILPDSVKQPNFLFLIADDMGIETMQSYGIGEDPAYTPNLDRLAANGIRVERFWAEPVCSPTRAAILTGRSGLQTGVTMPIYQGWSRLGQPPFEKLADAPNELEADPMGWIAEGEDITARKKPFFLKLLFGHEEFGLPTDEVVLPTVLKALPNAYATAAFGKWHLCDLNNGDLTHPNKVGFDQYEGAFFGMPYSHFKWRDVTNGQLSIKEGYVDEHYTKRAMSFIQNQKNTPWMVWMSLINPHTPLHLPPAHLLSSEKSKSLKEKDLTKENRRPFFNAQVEAMDALIGQLLSSIPKDIRDNTHIIFLGDNGTVKWSQPSPPLKEDRVKATMYTGGVEVPLIFSGPNIDTGKVIQPLAHVTDLFPTVLDLAGINYKNESPLTGVSMVPYLKAEQHPNPRQSVYSYITTLGNSWGIKNQQYKLTIQKGNEEFFDIKNDLLEVAPLPIDNLEGEALANYNLLKEETRKLGVE